MLHPYFEDYVVLPTTSTIRTYSRNIERDLEYRVLREDSAASRWSACVWVTTFLEKHAWISAGLVWLPLQLIPAPKQTMMVLALMKVQTDDQPL